MLTLVIDNNKIDMNIIAERAFTEGFKGIRKNDTETLQIVEASDDYIKSFVPIYSQLATEAYLNKTRPGGKSYKVSTSFAVRSLEPGHGSTLALIMDSVFPIMIVVVYALPMVYIIQRAVEEKASKTRESMRMMGMRDLPYWLSWFTMFTGQITVISAILTLGSVFTLLSGSNFIIVFLIFFLYGLSIFGFTVLVISFFDTIKTATVAGMCLNLLIYYFRYALPAGTPLIVRIITSIFPSLNLYNMQASLWQNQFIGGVGFSNITDIYNTYSIALFLAMSLINILFWTLVGFYVSAIVPTEFGTRKHPCFCFMFRRRRARTVDENGERYSLLLQNNSDYQEDMEHVQSSDAFEKVGNDLKEMEAKDE